MKNILTYCIVAIFLFVAGSTYAQTNPTNVQIDGKAHYQHGYNSSGGPDLPQEERDSVTVTSTMKYFVLPDRAFNSNFYDGSGNIIDPVDVTKLTSTFEWSVKTPAVGTTDGSTTHISAVTWGANPAIDTLIVREKPTSGGTVCEGTPTKIPVAVIAKPVIGFDQVSSQYSFTQCVPGVTSSNKASYTFDVTATSSSSQVIVGYTLSKDGGAATPYTASVNMAAGGSFVLEFEDYGAYTVVITSITDRVSRKSSVAGVITSGANQFVYNLIKPAQTGPIYHIPNLNP
ncbi:MAG: hypothetical protein LBQ60_18335 [Bacteroidales bacterium]|jgi:hypothetical protein|nr:hypothetical protein [Bacteroidales bacterium]